MELMTAEKDFLAKFASWGWKQEFSTTPLLLSSRRIEGSHNSQHTRRRDDEMENNDSASGWKQSKKVFSVAEIFICFRMMRINHINSVGDIRV